MKKTRGSRARRENPETKTPALGRGWGYAISQSGGGLAGSTDRKLADTAVSLRSSERAGMGPCPLWAWIVIEPLLSLLPILLGLAPNL